MMLTIDELKEGFVIVKLKGAAKYRIRYKGSGDFLLGLLDVPLETNNLARATEIRDRRVELLFKNQPDAWEEVE